MCLPCISLETKNTLWVCRSYLMYQTRQTKILTTIFFFLILEDLNVATQANATATMEPAFLLPHSHD